MPIDTFIDGDPVDISRIGDWLRRSLAVAVESAGDDAAAARRIAGDAWDGDASEAFLREATSLVHSIDAFQARVLDTAGHFDQIAAALTSVLAEMADICDRAATAGLSVVCNTIADPAPQSDETVLLAYSDAAAAAQDVHARWAREVAAVANRWASEAWAASFTTTTVLDYLTADLKKTVQGLTERADGLTRHSLQSMQFVLDLPDGTPYDEVRRLYGAAQGTADDLAATTAKHAQLADIPGRLAVGTGALSLVAGVGIDYYGGGESLEQAVVSNSAGLAASIAAGAIAGSIVPFGGTVVGALAGTVVGIIASGGVDHLYEDSSGGIMSALKAGGNELGEAGSALSDLGDLTLASCFHAESAGGLCRSQRKVL
ncbi:hypothetical protein ACFWCF_19065 [Rhodococcus sp. NPDC060090]|uniref:hypothetical protein n=1 Tax=Rhodococcus sp. NPDC060090 TaxID=3347056 RepID=UPI003658AEC2